MQRELMLEKNKIFVEGIFSNKGVGDKKILLSRCDDYYVRPNIKKSLANYMGCRHNALDIYMKITIVTS